MPSRPPGIASRAPSAATRMSHATASCMPAPIAGPLIAAITGAGYATIVVEHALERGPERIGVGTVIGREARHEVGAGAERRARAGDDDGAEVRPVTQMLGQLVAEFAVQCVAALLTVDRQEADRAALLESDHQDSSMIAMKVAFLHGLFRHDVQLPHDARDLGDDGDLHLHRFEDADLVALRRPSGPLRRRPARRSPRSPRGSQP